MTWVVEIQIQVFMLARQAFYWLNNFPALQFFLLLFLLHHLLLFSFFLVLGSKPWILQILSTNTFLSIVLIFFFGGGEECCHVAQAGLKHIILCLLLLLEACTTKVWFYLKNEEKPWLSQFQSRETDSVFLCLFVLSEPLQVREDAAHIGEGGSSSFSLLIQMLIYSGNTLTDTPRERITQGRNTRKWEPRLEQKPLVTPGHVCNRTNEVGTHSHGKCPGYIARLKTERDKTVYGIIYNVTF